MPRLEVWDANERSWVYHHFEFRKTLLTVHGMQHGESSQLPAPVYVTKRVTNNLAVVQQFIQKPGKWKGTETMLY